VDSRGGNIEVKTIDEKQLTKMPSASQDNFLGLTPPKKPSLGECLEFAREDECV
jgi:GTP-binding protein